MKIKKHFIVSALAVAIESQSTYEKNHHGDDYQSAMVSVWKECLENLKKGEQLNTYE